MPASNAALDAAIKSVAEVATSAHGHTDDIHQVVADEALALFRGHSASVWIPDGDVDDEHLCVAASAGSLSPEVLQIRLPRATTSIGRVSVSRSPLLLVDVPVEDVPPQTAMLARVFRIRSAMMLPYAQNGTLVLASELPGSYDNDALRLADVFALFTSSAASISAAAEARGRKDLATRINGGAMPLLDAALGEIYDALTAGRRAASRSHLEAAASRLEAGLARVRRAVGE